ncbi:MULTISPECIES: 5-formyltetrahydrofolate cyclo-ligase [Cyanophyceae]|nr:MULTISPECIES: 5-formyltetrahydrofolate cyclo-ligase [Cyanophyceae]SMH33466.1 5-formyltetrahydrofolate cyclo-ligase [Picosynechococcus sp. OG1]SMQ84414.1 5-formyltetrahydrofolate cyclo-ligase [Synechococcus sp. 7002]
MDMDQKTHLRQTFKQRRRSLFESTWQQANAAICQQLQDSLLWRNSTTVLGYLSHHREPCLQALLSAPKTWGLPRCVGDDLAWHHYQMGDRLIPGKFGIREPEATAPLIDLTTIDLVLVPALACSQTGDRLGYGAGFYDRFFATLPQPVTTVGIVFECCFVPTLPNDPWDVPLDYVCTEKRLIKIAQELSQ